jgi:hypothetical protein
MNDPLALLKQDHEAVKKLLKALRRTEEGPTRRSLLADLDRSIALHARLETELETAAGSDISEAGARQSELEHNLVNRSLENLHNLADSPEFCMAVAMLGGGFKHHVKSIERQVLPQLKAAVGKEGWRSLGDHIAVASSDARTEPQPARPLQVVSTPISKALSKLPPAKSATA